MNHDEKKYHITKLELALRKISSTYYKVSGMKGVELYNERIFLMELYHQLRIIYKDHSYYIDGEYRKGIKHFLDIEENYTIIPDLIIHERERMENNIVAIELKTTPILTAKQICRDLDKLNKLTDPKILNYKIGIFLIINYDFRKRFNVMRNNFKEIIRDCIKKSPRVAIWNISAYDILKKNKKIDILKADDAIFS